MRLKKRNANERVNESGNFRAEAQEGAARGERAASGTQFWQKAENFNDFAEWLYPGGGRKQKCSFNCLSCPTPLKRSIESHSVFLKLSHQFLVHFKHEYDVRFTPDIVDHDWHVRFVP